MKGEKIVCQQRRPRGINLRSFPAHTDSLAGVSSLSEDLLEFILGPMNPSIWRLLLVKARHVLRRFRRTFQIVTLLLLVVSNMPKRIFFFFFLLCLPPERTNDRTYMRNVDIVSIVEIFQIPTRDTDIPFSRNVHVLCQAGVATYRDDNIFSKLNGNSILPIVSNGGGGKEERESKRDKIREDSAKKTPRQ